jgi:DNA-binding NarL/FixJ family response regulator
LSNLEWLSKSLNQIHAFKTGLQQAGEGHGQAFLKESDMDAIFGLCAQGYSYQKIANHLNVGMATISDIIKRRTWTTVTNKYFL